MRSKIIVGILMAALTGAAGLGSRLVKAPVVAPPATRQVPASREDLARVKKLQREIEDLGEQVQAARERLFGEMTAGHGIDPTSALDAQRGVWIAPVTSAEPAK